MPKINFKKVSILSAAVIAAQILLIKIIYPIIDGMLHNYLSWLPQGSNLQNIGLLSLSIFVSITAGMLIYEQKYIKLWQGRNLNQRLAAILLYSNFVAMFIVFLLGKSISLPTIIGSAINIAIISFIIIISANRLNFPRV